MFPSVPDSARNQSGYFIGRKAVTCDDEKIRSSLKRYYMRRPFLVWLPGFSSASPASTIRQFDNITNTVSIKWFRLSAILLFIAAVEFYVALIVKDIRSKEFSSSTMVIALTLTFGCLFFLWVSSKWRLACKWRYELLTYLDSIRYSTKVSTTILILAIIGVWFTCILIEQMHIADKQYIINTFAVIPRDVKDGQLYRLLTGPVLHFHIKHLVLNLLGIYIFGSIVEYVSSHRVFWSVTFGSMIAGALGTTYLSTYSASVGISGAIFGLGCFAVVFQKNVDRKLPASIRILLSISLVSGIIFSVINYNKFDVYAHIVGGFFGLLFGLAASFRHANSK